MEEILMCHLSAGIKAALEMRAERHRRSVEAEACDVRAKALERGLVMLVDLLSDDDGADIDFKPGRLALSACSAEL